MIEDTAAKLWHNLAVFYHDTFYPAFLKYFVHNRDTLWILIGALLILAVASSLSYIKARPIWSKIIGNICAILVILICVVGFLRFAPDFFKFEPTSNSSTTTSTQNTTPTQNTTKTTPQNTTPRTTTPQTQKQLWYTVSCSSCWAEGCNHNGYSYNGLSSEYYSYYRNICNSCRCNDSRSQSYWR